ncbi:MAG: Zn-binding domain-containing protein [Spirochaetia bacterium]
MHTTAYWVCFPEWLEEKMSQSEIQNSLLGLSNILVNVAPIYLMCDPMDIRVVYQVKSAFDKKPAIYIYDNYPGGIGLAETLSRKLPHVLAAALALLDECECEEGCPSCIGPRDSRNEIDVNPKAAVRDLLSGWLQATEVAV